MVMLSCRRYKSKSVGSIAKEWQTVLVPAAVALQLALCDLREYRLLGYPATYEAGPGGAILGCLDRGDGAW